MATGDLHIIRNHDTNQLAVFEEGGGDLPWLLPVNWTLKATCNGKSVLMVERPARGKFQPTMPNVGPKR